MPSSERKVARDSATEGACGSNELCKVTALLM